MKINEKDYILTKVKLNIFYSLYNATDIKYDIKMRITGIDIAYKLLIIEQILVCQSRICWIAFLILIFIE